MAMHNSAGEYHYMLHAMHTYLLLGEVDLPSFLRRQLEHQLTIETQLVLQNKVYRIGALSSKLMNVKTALDKSLL